MTIFKPTPLHGGVKRLQQRLFLNKPSSHVWLLQVMVLVGVVSVGAIARPQTSQAQEISSPLTSPPGLCAQSDSMIAGHWVNDGTGQMVPLPDLCHTVEQYQTAATGPDDEGMGETARAGVLFWQTFMTAASTDALNFAQSVDMASVLTYGQTICASLAQSMSMDELRAFQIEGGLPPSFDAAVNVAAIHTYCPEHRVTIGR